MIIVITGPTCSSKSKIAIEVAKEFDAEIINADAFQIYKELDLGTAKPSKKDLNEVTHHLYSYIFPTEPYSIYQYQKDARNIIDSLIKQNKNIVIVGGSGLYIRSILYDFNFKEEKKIDLSSFEKLDNIALHKKLEEIDIDTAKKIHPNNRRRLLRALYIYCAYGKRKSELEALQTHKIIYSDVHIYAILVDNDNLYKNIDKRVIQMIDSGLIEEVNNLINKYPKDLQSLKAIGYKEIINNPNMSKKNLIALIQKNTRHYAKRQMTFIRHQYGDSVKWVHSSQDIIKDLKQ